MGLGMVLENEWKQPEHLWTMWSKNIEITTRHRHFASIHLPLQGPLARHPIWQKCEPHWDRTNWVHFFGSWVRCSKHVDIYKVEEYKFAALCGQMFDGRHWSPLSMVMLWFCLFELCLISEFHHEILRFQNSLSMSKLLQPEWLAKNIERDTATCKATSVSARRPGRLVCKARILS